MTTLDKNKLHVLLGGKSDGTTVPLQAPQDSPPADDKPKVSDAEFLMGHRIRWRPPETE